MGTVVETRIQTPSARSIQLDVPGWPGNIAGQHLDVRLTAEDGYTAVRSYSIASVGDGERIELAVDRLPTGEVSPYLVEELRAGDQLEVRGPLGTYFVWHPTDTAPVQLIAGGSGIVPLMAMIRSHETSGSTVPFHLLYSVRSPRDVFFADELRALAESPHLRVTYVYTRQAPPDWPIAPARITTAAIAADAFSREENPVAFVCGPTGFVETVADIMVGLRIFAPLTIKTERFGGK
nr:ferredoxin reductase [Glaciihabitans tibetensis]